MWSTQVMLIQEETKLRTKPRPNYNVDLNICQNALLPANTKDIKSVVFLIFIKSYSLLKASKCNHSTNQTTVATLILFLFFADVTKNDYHNNTERAWSSTFIHINAAIS